MTDESLALHHTQSVYASSISRLLGVSRYPSSAPHRRAVPVSLSRLTTLPTRQICPFSTPRQFGSSKRQLPFQEVNVKRQSQMTSVWLSPSSGTSPGQFAASCEKQRVVSLNVAASFLLDRTSLCCLHVHHQAVVGFSVNFPVTAINILLLT